MIGMPPVCGFVSKWYLVNGTLQTGRSCSWWALADVHGAQRRLLRADLYRAFFKAPVVDIEKYKEAP
jgi:multicomponent Na+:H+ antiporter subunit D